MSSYETGEQRIELLFRNGTLTVVGIVLAFSLGFLTHWASNPIPWTLVDLPTIVLIALGIILQMLSLLRFLRHKSLEKSYFDKASNLFVAGVVSTVIGVISAVVIDFVQLIL